MIEIVVCRPEHFGGVEALWLDAFPDDPPWNAAAVAISHLRSWELHMVYAVLDPVIKAWVKKNELKLATEFGGEERRFCDVTGGPQECFQVSIEGQALIANLDPAVWEVVDVYLLASQGSRDSRWAPG